MILLRLIHILSGVFWAGSAVLVAGWLLPTAKALGAQGTAFMQHLMIQRRLIIALLSAALLTILSGFGMFWYDTSISGGAFARSSAGGTYSAGALAAIAAAIIGGTVSRPTVMRMMALAESIRTSGTPPTPEQQATLAALGRRLTGAAHAVAGLVAIAVVTMAIGRYV